MNKIDAVVNLSTRRRFVYPSSELYGAPAGFYNYGPLGVELKRRVESSWWDCFVRSREEVVGIDACILSQREVWEASGHLKAFNDPIVECVKCKLRERADHLIERELGLEVEGAGVEELQKLVAERALACPKCKGVLSVGEPFSLMFKTHAGVLSDESSEAYLRPETAQGIFTDYKTIALAARLQPPFGIAQIGKSFRNEISPRQFVFRCREFTHYELEYFYDKECPFELRDREALVLTSEGQGKKDAKAAKKKLSALKASGWMKYWLGEYLHWLESIGLKNLRLRQHVKKELSHYSSDTWDIEFEYAEWGWKELLGIAERGSFDIDQHEAQSKKDLSLSDGQGRKIKPRVIEPSGGVDRLILALLVQGYRETDGKTVLSLSPEVAPVRACVFPLVKKDGLFEKGREVFESIRSLGGVLVEFDEKGSIGKRYARADEAGVPWCITIDYDTMKDDTVTLRERDTGRQERVKVGDLKARLA